MRKNQLDRRTGVSRVLERVANDLAGWANVSAAEEIAIRRAAFLTVLCGWIDAWCLKQRDVIVDAELLGPLKKGLTTHQANLIRKRQQRITELRRAGASNAEINAAMGELMNRTNGQISGPARSRPAH